MRALTQIQVFLRLKEFWVLSVYSGDKPTYVFVKSLSSVHGFHESFEDIIYTPDDLKWLLQFLLNEDEIKFFFKSKEAEAFEFVIRK